MPILRMFKIRTSEEIEQEKYALKILRGDFGDMQQTAFNDLHQLKQAIEKT